MAEVVLVCGSTSWTDGDTIRERLSQFPRGTLIISGGAKGADRLAATISNALGLALKEMPAFWREGGVYNPGAGFERNLRMLDQRPGRVIAFWDGKSKGTAHTIEHAHRRGITVEIVYPRRDYPGGTVHTTQETLFG